MKRETHIESVEKLTDNHFLNMYHLGFHDRSGRARDYYFCSRNSTDKLKIRTHSLEAEGICIFALTEEKHPRLAVIHEYRFPLDEYIYTLPAGLIDPGETPGEAAEREMMEETGFHFREYAGGEAFMRRPFFLAPGFSDEPGCAVFGTISGNSKPRQESSEWIDTALCTKDEVRSILEKEKVSVRAAFLMMQYLNSSDDDPFSFLSCRR